MENLTKGALPMAVGKKIEYARVEDLYLDPFNPRLGRSKSGGTARQETILDLMADWSLEELAVSFLENGFWPQEALLVCKEALYEETTDSLVVIEGNRRLAALKMLRSAFEGQKGTRKKWLEMVAGLADPGSLFGEVPYILVDSRDDVDAFLGFRHVTGIKEWKPAEKAQYIASLIEKKQLPYEEVRKMIGSKMQTVQKNYISYRLLLQMEGEEDISIEQVENKFSVLYLSLRTIGVQKFLQIDIKADPVTARTPVPADRLEALSKFALWLFGTDKIAPIVPDSRQIEQFGKILESEEAVAYLERSDKPIFSMAQKLAGGDIPALIENIQRASDNVRLALSTVHQYQDNSDVIKSVEVFSKDATTLIERFPQIKKHGI
jgi:hypothetical protein